MFETFDIVLKIVKKKKKHPREYCRGKKVNNKQSITAIHTPKWGNETAKIGRSAAGLKDIPSITIKKQMVGSLLLEPRMGDTSRLLNRL